MRGLRHKSIVAYEDEFLHSVPRGFKTEHLDYCIIMEYCANGDLTDYIRQVRQECLEADANTTNL